jgi:MFS family permease
MPVRNESAIVERIWHKPQFVLIASALIVFISFGIRQSFGLFMLPITSDLGWGRETLSLSLATQNLMIGIAAPFAGALAARWGAPRTVALGGVVFGLGILVMSQSMAPAGMFAGAGLMAGIGLGACGLPLILATVAQVAPEAKRSLWLGVATACATGGQLMVVPLTQSLLNDYDWVIALLVLSMLAGMIVPMAFSMSAAITPETGKDTDIGIGQAIREAAGHRGFLLLTTGFYVCGFHVAFIAVHLPSYLVDRGASPALGATALMLIAFFNMIGAWGSGWLAGRVSKKYILSTIYVVRSLIILIFITLPMGPITVAVFAASIGLMWLSTVPPTSGLVVQIFGTRYMGMLYGVVYLSHQLGSFTGVWLGGLIFEATGNYDIIWRFAIGLGITSALLHLPINDRPVERLAKATV